MKTAAIPATLLALVLAVPAWAAGEDESRWNALRTMLFQDRPIHDGAEVLALDAPYRAHDAAVVPISLEPAFSRPRNATSGPSPWSSTRTPCRWPAVSTSRRRVAVPR